MEVSPPPPEARAEARSARREPVSTAAASDDVFATGTIPPTALPEEDPAESDSGEPSEEAEGQTPAASAATPAEAPPPATPPCMPMSPPPLPSVPAVPARSGVRRGSADLLSVSHSSPGILRRPSLPVTAADRSPGHVTAGDRSPGRLVARSGASSPVPPSVNGVHRPSRVAAGLAWAERQGVRQTARDLLDPRRLPEATAGQQEAWHRGQSGTGKGELVLVPPPRKVRLASLCP